MKQILIFLTTGLFCLLLLGCGGDTAVSTPTPLAQLPTSTPTVTKTSTPTPTDIPKPTATPTPPITVTAIPERIDFPSWVTDPTVNVLLFETTNEQAGNYAISLLNTQTGEQFDIPFMAGGDIRWAQDESGLKIRVSFREERGMLAYEMVRPVWFIDIKTGLISHEEVVRNTLSESDQTIIRSFPSPNDRYIAQAYKGDGDSVILSIVNQLNGEENKLLDPFDGLYSDWFEVSWSPDGQLLAVGRVNTDLNHLQNNLTQSESALTIFSADGRLLNQFEHLYGGSLQWSPELPYRIINYVNDSAGTKLCILDISTSTNNCLDSIKNWRVEKEAETGVYKWAPDSQKIGFSVWKLETLGGGFCFIDLETELINCPIFLADLQDTNLHYRFVQNYQWSPDGLSVALILGITPPTSDDRAFQSLMIINLVSGELLAPTGANPTYREMWRPELETTLE